MLRMYLISLSDIRGQIAKAYEQYGNDDGSLGFDEMSKYNRLNNLEKAIQEEVRRLTRRTVTRLKKGIGYQFEESYLRTAFSLERTVKAKLAYRPLSPEVLQAAIENPLDRVGWLRRNTDNQARLFRQLREELTQGLIQGKSYRDTARAIKERMDAGAENVMRIVRTETHRVQQKGRLDSFKHAQAQGVVMKKVWITTKDDRTRDSHADLDGQAVGIDEEFSIRGLTASQPGGFGVPEEDIHCRCSIRAKVEDFQPPSSREQGEGVIPQDSYEEWKADRINS